MTPSLSCLTSIIDEPAVCPAEWVLVLEECHVVTRIQRQLHHLCWRVNLPHHIHHLPCILPHNLGPGRLQEHTYPGLSVMGDGQVCKVVTYVQKQYLLNLQYIYNGINIQEDTEGKQRGISWHRNND